MARTHRRVMFSPCRAAASPPSLSSPSSSPGAAAPADTIRPAPASTPTPPSAPRSPSPGPPAARDFAAPSGTTSATITFPGVPNNGFVATVSQTVQRPDVDAAVTKTYQLGIAIQPGRRLMRVDFSVGNGGALATALLNVLVQNDGALRTLDGKPLGTVSAASNVTSLVIAADQTVEAGVTAPLVVSAVAEGGGFVALPTGALSLTVASGGEFLRANADGTVTGLAPGTATLTAAYQGLTSPAVAVAVLPAPIVARSVDLATADLVADPTSDRLYAALPPNAAKGNSVVSIDGATGAIGTSIPVGSDPNSLALSDDGTVLYVGLRGSSGVRRVDLATGVAGPTYPVPTDPVFFNSPTFVGSLAVRPGNPSTYAATVQTIFNNALGPFVFDDGVARPNHVIDFRGTRILWTAPDRIVAFSTNSSSGLLDVAVDGQGATLTRVVQNGSSGRLIKVDDRLYDSTGGVFDAATLERLGTLTLVKTDSSASNFFGPVVDPVAKRAYFVEVGVGSSLLRLHTYDTDSFLRISNRRISNVAVTNTFYVADDVFTLRVGTKGLVLHLSGQLIFIDNLSGL